MHAVIDILEGIRLLPQNDKSFQTPERPQRLLPMLALWIINRRDWSPGGDRWRFLRRLCVIYRRPRSRLRFGLKRLRSLRGFGGMGYEFQETVKYYKINMRLYFFSRYSSALLYTTGYRVPYGFSFMGYSVETAESDSREEISATRQCIIKMITIWLYVIWV